MPDVSYPSDLTAFNQKYIDQQVSTPNTNATIMTPGTVARESLMPTSA